MDLRDYRELPDNGMFEKIERRLRVRRAARIAVAVTVVAAVAGVVLLLEVGGRKPEVGLQASSLNSPMVTAAGQPEVAMEQPVAGRQQQAEVVTDRQVEKEDVAILQSPAVREEEMAVDVVSGSPVAEVTKPTVNEVPVQIAVEEPVAVEAKEVQEIEKPVAEKGGAPTQETQHYDNLLWAPNAIAPAADDERNRVFKVTATSDVSHFHLIIFNRGGRQVFATDDINEAWDATLGGAPLSQGTYVWVAKFRDSDGVLRQEKGTVTVIR